MLDDLVVKINVDTSPLLSAAPKVNANLTQIKTSADSLDKRLMHLNHNAATAAFGLRTLGTALGSSGALATTAGGGVLHFTHQIHAAQIATDLLITGLRVLLIPIRIIGAVGAAVFRGLTVIMNTVLLPVRLLAAGFAMIARAAMSIVGPLLGIGLAVAKVWFIFKGWIGAFKVLYGWLNLLPPKLRLLVGGLMLLGVAGKAGSLALSVFATAARVAATGLQLLLLPIQLITNPARALTSAMNLLGRSILFAGSLARRAATSFASMAMSLGSSIGGVVAAIGGKLLSVLKSGVTGFALLGGAASAWGIKMATKAETATVVFGTMLKSMTAGKALMNDLEGWSGAPLFDPEQIQLSGTLLFKAGIAAADITGKLDQLGNIAAATKTPLEDLAKIYQQGMNQGAFQQDKINQLSDRGIAIYEGLAFATGKSGAALKEMIRDGKIGPAEMNAAIEHLTTGTGIYAGAIANIAKTTGGMWSTMISKVGITSRELGKNIMSAFNFKGLMTQATTFFENLTEQLASAMPAFTAVATVVTAAFAAVWEVVSVTFNAITAALGVTGGNWMTSFLEWSAIASWAFGNWPDIAKLAFVNVGLYLVQFGADVAHLFTGVMPALFSWFGSNWVNLFKTAGSFVASVFTNIAKNIKNAMLAIWDFIKSGGTQKLSIAWVPLLDGFKNTVAALPDIPPRAIGELERSLQAQSIHLGETLGSSLGDAIGTNMRMLADFEATQAAYVPPTLEGITAIDPATYAPPSIDGGHSSSDSTKTTDTDKNKRTSFAVDSLDRGSEAALKAVFANQKDDKTATHALTEHKKTNKYLGQLVAKNDGPKVAVQGAV